MMISTKPRHTSAPLTAPLITSLITPLITMFALICPVFTAEAQNVVTDSAITATADPIKLSIDQIKHYVLKTPDFGGAIQLAILPGSTTGCIRLLM